MMRHKIASIITTLVVLIYFSFLLYAGAVIVDFRGEPGSNMVTLYWSTLNETKCKGFQIERSLNKTDFEKIDFVKGVVNSSQRKDYKFVDKTVFKAEINRTYYYRIKIVNEDNSVSVYAQVISVTPSISGARYTWGSIKALFR
jgi:hypothetical protein